MHSSHLRDRRHQKLKTTVGGGLGKKENREGKKNIYQVSFALNGTENVSAASAADHSPHLWRNQPLGIMHFTIHSFSKTSKEQYNLFLH